MAAVLVLILTVVLSFQNCGNYGLMGAPRKLTTLSADGGSPLPKPYTSFEEFRLVFFVDMSFSMPFGLCKSDAAAEEAYEKEEPASDTAWDCGMVGVHTKRGADPDMWRLSILKKWLEDALTLPNANKIKVLIVPFTGGVTEQQRQDRIEFVSLQEALVIIDTLAQQQQQIEDFYNLALRPPGADVPPPPTKLATSVPSNRLDAMMTEIRREAQSLKDQNLIAMFEVVAISDGVPKPQKRHAERGVQILWKYLGMGSLPEENRNCPTPDPLNRYTNNADCFCQCGSILHDMIENDNTQSFEVCHYQKPVYRCDYDGDGQYDEWCRDVQNNYCWVLNTNEEAGESHSVQEYLQDMTNYWGNYKTNTPPRIARKLYDVRKYLESSTSNSSRLSVIWINRPGDTTSFPVLPPGVGPVTSTDESNWIVRAHLLGAANRFALLSSPEPPFPVATQVSANESYRIGSAFFINPHVRLDGAGRLRVDSDGDGLFDDEESGEFSPSNPRSNDICLDIITKMGLCQTQMVCDPQYDLDGDGLSECDERALGTNERDFDSDGDGIPDGLELLYGTNPLTNDQTEDLNLDGITNFEAFKQGANPNAPLKTMTGNMKVNLEVNGTPDAYAIYLHNAPIRQVLVSNAKPLYSRRDLNEMSKWEWSPVGGSHTSGRVPVYLILRVENAFHSKEVHWGFIKWEFPGALDLSFKIDLGTMKYINVIDPFWGADR